MLVYHVAPIDHSVASIDYTLDVRQKLSFAEFVWARKSIACGTEDRHGLNIYGISTCNLLNRWSVPSFKKALIAEMLR